MRPATMVRCWSPETAAVLGVDRAREADAGPATYALSAAVPGPCVDQQGHAGGRPAEAGGGVEQQAAFAAGGPWWHREVFVWLGGDAEVPFDLAV